MIAGFFISYLQSIGIDARSLSIVQFLKASFVFVTSSGGHSAMNGSPDPVILTLPSKHFITSVSSGNG